MMDIGQLNLRHLQVIAKIGRLGSIRAAAEAVGLTQPAITQALGKLERQLGIALFERRPDGMAGTRASELLTPRIEAALTQIGSTRVTMAQLGALIAVARESSYSGASALTGLSEPSLHRAVGDLSIALNRRLVERRGRGIVLSDAGKRTARAFRLARAELEAGLSEIDALLGQETGRVTIGAMPLSRARLLPAAVTAFHKQHPKVEIRIVEGSHAELLEPLRDGEIDFLIGALRSPSPGSDVEQVALFDDRPVVIGRVGHPISSPDIGQLAAYPWTISAPGTPLRMLWERMFEQAGVAPPRVPIECGSVIAIRQLLRDSDFLTLLSPDQVAVELEAGWLSNIGAAPGDLRRTIGLTTRADWRPTAMQMAFLDMVRPEYGQESPELNT
jgi:LysR family transcriptional regulator of gallate degradation